MNQWSNCELCDLCGTRSNVVGYTGGFPSDLLFIGDAPTAGDNIIGEAFAGPPRKELNRWVELARSYTKHEEVKVAFTYLVGCIPLVDGERKVATLKQVAACRERLGAILAICQPRGVILVGDASKPRLKPIYSGPMIHVKHPSSIRGLNSSKKALEVLRIITEIKQLMEEVL